MARQLRIEIAGGTYHITSRGNARKNIFRDDRDRRRMLDSVSTAVNEYGWLVHAYCLMPNHYHLLIETPLPNLSRGMKKINGTYAQGFNARHQRVGHVFQDRFHSILVDKEDYLLTLSRYIVLNPVRAKIVAAPEEWTWSSYRPTIGTGPRPRFLTCEQILGYFGESREKARRAYSGFVNGNLAQKPPWTNLLGGVILGSEGFLKRIRGRLTERESRELDRLQATERRPPLEQLFSKRYTRPLSLEVAGLAQEISQRHGYSIKEIAHFLGIHQSTLCKAIHRRAGR
jgi:REP element-mobilizing transposase RayT